MSVWTAIVAIVAIIAWVEVRKARYGAHPGRMDRDETPRGFLPPRRDEAEMAREIAELRQRLEVLERIATEDRTTRSLAEEIDRLR